VLPISQVHCCFCNSATVYVSSLLLLCLFSLFSASFRLGGWTLVVLVMCCFVICLVAICCFFSHFKNFCLTFFLYMICFCWVLFFMVLYIGFVKYTLTLSYHLSKYKLYIYGIYFYMSMIKCICVNKINLFKSIFF
jgi:hypothetical protein